MPLKRGKSKTVISENISEMMGSPTFAKGKPKTKKQSMAVAAALQKARASGAKIPKPRKTAKKSAKKKK